MLPLANEIFGRELCRLIVPASPYANTIFPAASPFADVMALRNDPVPESFRFVTV
jgi:hypothetical protein